MPHGNFSPRVSELQRDLEGLLLPLPAPWSVWLPIAMEISVDERKISLVVAFWFLQVLHDSNYLSRWCWKTKGITLLSFASWVSVVLAWPKFAALGFFCVLGFLCCFWFFCFSGCEDSRDWIKIGGGLASSSRRGVGVFGWSLRRHKRGGQVKMLHSGDWFGNFRKFNSFLSILHQFTYNFFFWFLIKLVIVIGFLQVVILSTVAVMEAWFGYGRIRRMAFQEQCLVLVVFLTFPRVLWNEMTTLSLFKFYFLFLHFIF